MRSCVFPAGDFVCGMSFGGGDAYMTIADGIFVGGGMITSQQYYNHIVPAVNVLPGSILCKPWRQPDIIQDGT